MTASEFARPIRIDTLGEGSRTVDIMADAGERAALAARFDLIAIDRLAASAQLTRQGDDVTVDGRIAAAVVQACVATGEPVPAEVDMGFALRFVPALVVEGDEVELDPHDLDVVAYEGGAVDLGEAVAETLALSLDPFPRAPEAGQVLKAAGVIGEDEVEPAATPFAALQALKDRLG